MVDHLAQDVLYIAVLDLVGESLVPNSVIVIKDKERGEKMLLHALYPEYSADTQ